ncbi:Outer membrane protein P5 [Ephemeroptericola cinctiostellae]|uniref:Outer membrane protein P5 n=1 Tax=Ephemeroptericola cinctiostellae TaxID=2268024 RepID=A0A345DCG4_9BURK|nr:OmpA family protein [Ephemeroptericola cinctiostellae]AXF86052.1 Outer membrane protein P5 [Ephemeroptericola cinctiostellae]
MKTKKFAVKMLSTVAFLSLGSFASANDSTNSMIFPELKDSWLKTGDFTGPDHIRRIRSGMDKDQVALEIGNPHFNEGIGGPNVWNYAFNFYTGNADEYVTCQYQVHFDEKHTRVDKTAWKENQCAAFLEEKHPVLNQSHPLVLSSDGLFAFGKSGFNDLQQTGRENLHNLAGQIKTGYKTTRSISITGYTDRIGSVSSNQALSLARANTVKQYLISQGIDGSLIQTSGAGSNKPVVSCPGSKSPAVVACLMPNRRIEVSVNGDI